MTLALVTAGGRRIGAAIAARLASAGHDVAIHVRHDGPIDPTLEAVLAASGVRWGVFEADFEDEAAPAALLAAVEAHFGARPGWLVNNAARFAEEEAEAPSVEDYVDHFRVNAAVPAVLARAVAVAGAGAAIVNIVDQRILNPHADQAAYSASKLALAGMTRQLARALAPARVNAVAPGLTIATPAYAEGQMERLGAAMPLGRLPSAPEIADAVAWLLGAGAVTGQTIFVDGGAHLESWPRDFVHLQR